MRPSLEVEVQISLQVFLVGNVEGEVASVGVRAAAGSCRAASCVAGD